MKLFERIILYTVIAIMAFHVFMVDDKAESQVVIQEQIRARRISIVNDQGREVIGIRTTPENGGVIAMYGQNSNAELVMASSNTGGRIVTFNKNNGVGIAIISTENGGEIQINHKEGINGVNILVDENGSKIATIDKNNVIGTVMATVNSMGGGLIIFDEKGKNQRLYSSR
jgi:hypothetical protein